MLFCSVGWLAQLQGPGIYVSTSSYTRSDWSTREGLAFMLARHHTRVFVMMMC
jgi:hypothetical protein